jgi:hypothetical protein
MLVFVLDYLGCAKAGEKERLIVFVDHIVKEEQSEIARLLLRSSGSSNTTPSSTGAKKRDYPKKIPP